MPETRTLNLASCYENSLTTILRLSSLEKQSSVSSQDFRTSIRAALRAAMEQAKALGYSSESNELAFFAAVALLDESVLKLQHPAFSDWARRPLQEELFLHNRAGEVFFDHLRTLLARPDSAETGDCLEVYCLCMQLGFKGKYALGSSMGYTAVQPSSYTGAWSTPRPSAEISSLIHQTREKLARIRGQITLLPENAPPVVKQNTSTDRWGRTLGIIVLIMFVILVVSFAGFWFSLSSGASQLG